MPAPLDIALVVEDDLSLALMECILAGCERPYRIVLPKVERGFGNIKRSVAKYRAASRVLPHVVLTDLDNARCAADLRERWGVLELPETMLFRVAVREVEAWLLADRQGFASFAAIPVVKLPLAPDEIKDPKQALLNLVRRSRSRRLAEEIVPGTGSKAPVGPLYNERLIGFVREHWVLQRAVSHSPSLQRTLARLAQFLC